MVRLVDTQPLRTTGEEPVRCEGIRIVLSDRRRLVTTGRCQTSDSQPLFPGYLFLRDQLSGPRYVEILKARGLVGVLGGRNGGPDHIQDSEIEAIRALVLSDLPVSPYPYLRTGQRVRITDGPLTNVEGILVDRRADKGLLVLSVHLFRRSVAVEVDCALAVAA